MKIHNFPKSFQNKLKSQGQQLVVSGSKRLFHNKNKGFALISTIVISSLLLIIGLAMLSLSGVETKTVSSIEHLEEARSNAKMAAIMAIGELQRSTGSDMRVTAPANSYVGAGSDHVRQLYGVWHSWKAADHDDTGRPIPPDYTIKERTYDAANPDDGRFERWLVSGEDSTLRDPNNPPSVAEIAGVTVPLLVTGTSADEIHIEPTEVTTTNGTGLIAWAAIGENAKVMLKPNESTGGTAELLAINKLAVSPGPSGSAFDISDVDDTNKVFSRNTYGLITSSDDEAFDLTEFIHDLTPFSAGLHTNVANGGWKRDMSLFSELFADIDDGFSRFTLEPGVSSDSNKFNDPGEEGEPSGVSGLVANMLPWDSRAGQDRPDSMSWAGLVEHMTQYKQFLTDGEPVVHMRYGYNHELDERDLTFDREPWADNVRRMPIVARIHQGMSITSVPALNNEGNQIGHHAAVLWNPVVTMWNPYNVAIDMELVNEPLRVRLWETGNPIEFDFVFTERDGSTSTLSRDLGSIVTDGHANSDDRGVSTEVTLRVPLDSPRIWLPGEVRTFSPTNNAYELRDSADSSGAGITMAEGYRPLSGLIFTIDDTVHDASVTMKIGGNRVASFFNGPNLDGIGIYFTQLFSNTNGRSLNNFQNNAPPVKALRMLGDELEVLNGEEYTMTELEDLPRGVMATMMSTHFARDVFPDQPDLVGDGETAFSTNNIVANGMHNKSPFTNFMLEAYNSNGLGSNPTEAAVDAAYPYWSDFRPENFPYQLTFFPVNDINSEFMPSGLTDEADGYIGGGFTANTGLSNLILTEIPTRPLTMIGDLQHFNINANASTGPYSINVIGNSRVSPFIHGDSINVSERENPDAAKPSSHDHSYQFNHSLMDDWFVSGIVPEVFPWSDDEERDLHQVYSDFISVEAPLINHYHTPVGKVGEEDADQVATDFLSDQTAFEKVASKMEVRGMFNINSTSELAWAMMLKRSFGSENGESDGTPSLFVMLDSAVGDGGSAGLYDSEEEGTPFPRTLLTSNPDAGSGGDEFLSQPIFFTDDQIEALAREIVSQIKLRGPFLSVSEFYNRQLSTNTALAQAGAVETALMTLSELGNDENPYAQIQSVYTDEASTTDVLGNVLEYPFPEAARGNPAYGFPGWARQADILRSISGLLSARDDTFTIRAYGASKDIAGNVAAEAWCEVVVTRSREFANGGDIFELPTDDTHPFGRKYVVRQFRWLHEDEVE